MIGDTRVVHVGTGDYRPIREWRHAGHTLAYDGQRVVPAAVSALATHGSKPVFRVTTSSGYHLTATAHHPLLTPEGWRPLAKLRAGDRVAIGGRLGIFGRVPLVDPVGLGRAFAARLVHDPDCDVPPAVFRAPPDDLWVFLRAATGESGSLGTRSLMAVDSLRHLFDRFGVTTFATADASGLIQLAVTSSLWMLAEYGARANGTTGTSIAKADAPQRFEPLVSIKEAGCESVYDLEVPTLHNFVANGLVIHNSTYARCGIIVNVTPFEPEWEGNVTLEFSNTTPLPAKIYANEGVAQVIFFEADEPCETSYRDRGGKYQGQEGVTLPKT
ncbi:MAG: dCTP deaminase domain-containing protein [Acidiferrobacter sp.]